MTPVSPEKRRLQLETLRVKIAVQIGSLIKLLDYYGHGEDCTLRCFSSEDNCVADHRCEVCGDDE